MMRQVAVLRVGTEMLRIVLKVARTRTASPGAQF